MRLAAVAALVVVLAPTAASAWTYVDLQHSHWETSFEILRGTPSDDLEAFAPGTTESELVRAIDDWTLVTCADVPMTYGGTAAAEAALGDALNVVGFVEADWPHDPTFLGMTSYESVPCAQGRCMVEADVELNGVNYIWEDVRGSLPHANARSIMLHELGHVLGLGHSGAQYAAMNPSYYRGYLILNQDDRTGLCTLYPRGEERVCAGGDCPFGQLCEEGACVTRALEPCTTAMDCAYDETCSELSGRCLQVAPGSDEIGIPCETDADCAEGVMCGDVRGARVCTVPCDGLDPRSCPSGFFCDRQATDDCGTGLCAEGTSSGGALGTACVAPGDCGSLFCADGICALPCDVTAPVCPAAMVCHADMDDGCGACAAPRPVGASCVDNAQCESDLCLVRGDAGTCTVPCESDDECPSGLRCLEEEAMRFCLAPPAPSDGCGCQSAAPSGSAAFLFLAIGLAWARRRRR